MRMVDAVMPVVVLCETVNRSVFGRSKVS
jgi:hypothetical protein